MKIVYIHGIGSSFESSSKARILEEYFGSDNVLGFNWSQDQNIEHEIVKFIKSNFKDEIICIVGSSSGGKIATVFDKYYQDIVGIKPCVVLLNPLSNINDLKSTNSFELTNELLISSTAYKETTESIIIYSVEDETINQTNIKSNYNICNGFIKVSDDHRLSNSNEIILETIDQCIYFNS